MTEQELSHPGRYIIGIDLGTTNCALCYIDLESPSRELHRFDIPQLVAAGEVASEPLLPSFTYLPGDHELPSNALALPWDDAPPHAVGRFAREQGARLPERLVSSAKSWLAHAGVDRTRPILPWGGDLGPQMVSPVDVSFFYLDHLRQAWDAAFKRKKDKDGTPCVLSEQQLIVTVPASFDETARELTLAAARRAGFRHLTLIEEPLAAFYAWLSRHEADWMQTLVPGDAIVVIDVGGGTTDFSLVELDEHCTLRRKAVGNHLLLGGDNMDMALAHQVESKWKKRLGQRQWTTLCLECRRAKELLLGDNPPQTASVHLSGFGSSVVAGSQKATFSREEVVQTILDGFFPDIPVDSPPPERRRGIQEMGLPYAADPSVTRHLLQFLKAAGPSLSTPEPMARPTAVLFNGGAMIPSLIRERILQVLCKWTGREQITELAASDFSLAVAEGAATYGLARRGGATRVKGGIANAYYLEIQTEQGRKLLCVMPRDTDEGVVCRLERPFQLQTNTLVAFPLHASATRLGDKLGDLLDPDDDITSLAPLQTSLKFGRRDEKHTITVTLASRLNEVGTLEVWCQATDTDHRFPLTFELRNASPSSPYDSHLTQSTVVDANRVDDAHQLLADAFSSASSLRDSLLKDMEAALDLQRKDWPATLLRDFADTLIANESWRHLSPKHDMRWLNLCGFCMRPGFGVIGDDDRVRRLWKLWHAGAPDSQEAALNWWLLWRRVAGGLSAGQQNQIAGMLAREMISKDMKTILKKDDALTIEKWRLVSTMEKVPVNLKLKCLNALIKGTGRLFGQAFWPIARLAARKLFAGPDDAVIPADKLGPLLPFLLAKAAQANMPSEAMLALAAAARLTGIRTLDISQEQRSAVIDALRANHASDDLLRPLETVIDSSAESWTPELLGDSLPLGLQLATT